VSAALEAAVLAALKADAGVAALVAGRVLAEGDAADVQPEHVDDAQQQGNAAEQHRPCIPRARDCGETRPARQPPKHDKDQRSDKQDHKQPVTAHR